jgi:hypothetical protein
MFPNTVNSSTPSQFAHNTKETFSLPSLQTFSHNLIPARKKELKSTFFHHFSPNLFTQPTFNEQMIPKFNHVSTKYTLHITHRTPFPRPIPCGDAVTESQPQEK